MYFNFTIAEGSLLCLIGRYRPYDISNTSLFIHNSLSLSQHTHTHRQYQCINILAYKISRIQKSIYGQVMIGKIVYVLFIILSLWRAGHGQGTSSKPLIRNRQYNLAPSFIKLGILLLDILKAGTNKSILLNTWYNPTISILQTICWALS